MTETASRWTRHALIAASVLLLAGGWIVLEAMAVELPPLARHWPLFIALGGVASIADYALLSRRPAALGLGLFGLALGIDVYLLTLGQVPWKSIGLWGPGLYLAIGLGCLGAWGADPKRSPRLLILGVVGVGLAVTFWGWGEVPLSLFWGLLLLLAGGAIVVSLVRQRRHGE